MSIDVALPYYGDVDLMKQAARSVLGQQFQDWRLIVVDDGYPDPEPRRWFGTIDDPRVSYQRNDQNLGANGNYRKALDLVTAPHVVVMGADDVMLPNFLQTVADAFAEFPDAAIAQVGVEVIDERGRAVRPLADRVKAFYRPDVDERTLLAGEKLAISLLRGVWTYFPSLAWRTDVIRRIGFRDGLQVTQDMALQLDVAREGGSLIVDPTLAFLYRRHSGSDSSIKALDGRRFEEERALFELEAEQFGKQGWTRAARTARWHLSSRLNALSLMPAAIRSRSDGASLPKLARHVVA